MNHSATAERKTIPAVAVMGADIDLSIARSLCAGDSVLAEVNGMRFYTEAFDHCPVVAEKTWTVEDNNPPAESATPNKTHRLVLSHPHVQHQLILHYSNLEPTNGRGPAVFVERNADYSAYDDGLPRPLYIVLQLVSHFMPAANVEHCFPHSIDDVSLMLSDERCKRAVLEQWVSIFKRFSGSGWGYKSVKRFAVRANVNATILGAFRVGDWEIINSANTETLLKIASEMAWMPYLRKLSPMTTVRQTLQPRTGGDDCYGDRGNAYN